jgi:transporter family protein
LTAMLTVLLVVVMVLFEAGGDVLITRGMRQIGPVSDFRPYALMLTIGHILRNRSFLGGVGLSSVRFAAFLILLSYVDLSIVIPSSALIFVVGTFAARVLLKENVTLQRWIGSCLVCVGVALVFAR